MRFKIVVALLIATPLAAAEITLDAPASTTAGGRFSVGWGGEPQSLDMVTVVTQDTEDGEYSFARYPARESSPMSFMAPDEAGDYEVRYLRYTNPGYTVLAKHAIKLTKPVAVAIVAPASVTPGKPFNVSWSGPNAAGDQIRLVTPGGAGTVLSSADAAGRSVQLTAPNQRGDYLVQYVRSGQTSPLGTVTLTVGPTAANRTNSARQIPIARAGASERGFRGAGATIEAPDSVMAGDPFEVRWTGPGNADDYVAIATSDSPRSALNTYRTNRGNPLRVVAPDEPGRYHLHYVAGRRELSLGSTLINVTASGQQGELRISAPENSAFQVYDLEGSVAGAGSANDEPMSLSAGDYVVRVDDRVVQVRVRAGGTTDLNLR